MARMLITAITRGGVISDSARCNGWATGFFIPCLGEGQQKTVSTETDFAGPTPPVLYDQSLMKTQILLFIAVGMLHCCSEWSPNFMQYTSSVSRT